MGRSTLERTGERPPDLTKGRTTRDLEPGDTTDSGSDLVGGTALNNLDSDSDSGGSGERGAAGRDAMPPTDQQLSIVHEPVVDEPLVNRRPSRRRKPAARSR